MKRLLIASLVAATAALTIPGIASAQNFSVRVGDGYNHGDNGWHHGWDRGRHRGWHAQSSCRVVITQRYRHGERVTVRRQICG